MSQLNKLDAMFDALSEANPFFSRYLVKPSSIINTFKKGGVKAVEETLNDKRDLFMEGVDQGTVDMISDSVTGVLANKASESFAENGGDASLAASIALKGFNTFRKGGLNDFVQKNLNKNKDKIEAAQVRKSLKKDKDSLTEREKLAEFQYFKPKKGLVKKSTDE